jgi:hypothetical protein
VSEIKARIKVGSLATSGLVILVLLGLTMSILVSGGGPSGVLGHCSGYGGEGPCAGDSNPFHGPESLGGQILGGPDVGSYGPPTLEIIARGTENQLYRNFFDGSSFSGFQPIGGSSNADPTAVGTLGPSFSYRTDFFARGNDAEGALWHAYVEGGSIATATFHGWEKIGGRLVGGPDSAVRVLLGPPFTQVSAFIWGLADALWQVYWDGFKWVFNRIGGTLTSDPGAIGDESAAARLDVFYRGTNGALKHLYWNGSAWSGVEDLGGQLIGGPDPLVRFVSGTLWIEVFMRGTDNNLYRKVWNGSVWGGFEFVGDDAGFDSSSDPGAASWDVEKRADIVWRGTGGTVQHAWKN